LKQLWQLDSNKKIYQKLRCLMNVLQQFQCVCGLFENTVSISDNAASNGRIISKELIAMDLEGSSQGLTQYFLAICLEGLEKATTPGAPAPPQYRGRAVPVCQININVTSKLTASVV
jgi:hypothetical protein